VSASYTPSLLAVDLVHAAEFFDLLVQAQMRPPCSLRLSAISQQYFSLRINQPPATSQQYFSLRTNQHQSSATSQTNRLVVKATRTLFEENEAEDQDLSRVVRNGFWLPSQTDSN
jgi:hypothetical protein